MDEFYRVPLTTAESVAAVAALRVLSEALSAAGVVSDIEPEVLASAAARIEEETPDFLRPQAARLAKALRELLASPNLADALGDQEDAHGEAPPFPTGRTRRLLEDAQERRAPVEIEYFVTRRNEWTTRRVEIADVYAQGDAWYLSGHCGLRGDFRQFRLDHIRGVRVLDGEGGAVRPVLADPFADE